MYFDGPRERFWADEGEDARGRLYAMLIIQRFGTKPKLEGYEAQ
jgi:hypothetical protein